MDTSAITAALKDVQANPVYSGGLTDQESQYQLITSKIHYFLCALSLRHITVKYLQSLMIKLIRKIEMDQRSYSWTTCWRPEKGSSVHHRGPAKAIISRETKDGWEI